jgi:hypothetical protein
MVKRPARFAPPSTTATRTDTALVDTPKGEETPISSSIYDLYGVHLSRFHGRTILSVFLFPRELSLGEVGRGISIPFPKGALATAP